MVKIAVIGGGSTYTPELLQGFLDRQDVFPIQELWLMDNDVHRLQIVGNFVKRLAKSKFAKFDIRLTTDRKNAIKDASYVITQLRVGKMAARREDEYLGQRHGLIGQETTGIGGMAKALRTIPVILGIADDIRKYAPNALLVNFTNPSGLITEALNRYAPEVHAVGVCNATLTTKMEILNKLNQHLGLNIQPEEVLINALGLNHLTWFYGFTAGDQDYWPNIMQFLFDEMQKADDPLFDPETLKVLGMLPNSYLRYYYYTDQMLAKQQSWPPSRAETVQDVEETLLSNYQEQGRVEIPKTLMLRGGAYYSTVAAQLLNAHYNDLEEIQVVNVRHHGAVTGWNPEWVLEMPCKISSGGIIPLPAKPLPLICESLITSVKAYEIMTVEAAVHHSRSAAFQALLAHPLGPSADKVKNVLDDMLETNKNYLEEFH